MRSTRMMLVAIVLTLATPALAAKPMSDRERKRAEAEHLCYDDVQKLCNADIPDETKIEACMKIHHGQLSPGCRKVFDDGLGD